MISWEPTRGEMDGLIVRKHVPNKSSIDGIALELSSIS